MEIKLTEKELQFLVDTASEAGVSLEITGQDKFIIHHPKATISGEILGFTDRTIVIGYSLGFWKNLVVNWLFKFEREGIIWNKKQRRFEINPFSFLPEKEKLATADFSIRGISMDPGSLQIQLHITPE
ncbi:hypothetical protein [Algoriphagus boritolerans]|uniref:Uncharacterized protein n=1 Tax=Algoriphagus boritolerans DSM 17298 = JCM 18970 TaxID=1120964 RepID=A0A1H5VQP6_9BACT|nr:hypothetical protein [Algoriphagus boritolerans]SEF89336.1 hypothetical protein SAMN03080598_01794 [Algoriphagus boritolerans DSM 17298 = JCM 18970]